MGFIRGDKEEIVEWIAGMSPSELDSLVHKKEEEKLMSELLHINLTHEFTQPQEEEPKVILTWTPVEFNNTVYRLVFCPNDNKYVKEVRRLNAMDEQVWVFDEAWHIDNHNGSLSGYRLCDLIRFLCGQLVGGVGAAKERKK